MIYDINNQPGEQPVIVDPIDHTRRKKMASNQLECEDLLVTVYRKGKLVYRQPDLNQIRNRVQTELAQLDSSCRRLVNPHQYTAGLEKSLFDLKTDLIIKLRNKG
jgi:nicotinate phosphoribosyltransferase